MQEIIYHITTKEAWASAKKIGFYEDPSLIAEGFIHCSTAPQVAGVLQRYFAGKTGLVKLAIDPSRLDAKLQFDHSSSVNEAFPHIYGKINLDGIVNTEEI